jgi:uncharacterized surface protein with fasciclin (FAS1) repeats
MPKISAAALFVVAALASLFMCAAPLLAATLPSQSILEIAEADGHYTTFLAAVKAADLIDELSGLGPITVFAPTDAAFAKLPPDRLADLMKPENKPLLRSLIQGDIIGQAVQLHSDGGDVSSGYLPALAGGSLTFGMADGSTTVEGAKIVKRDIHATNGYFDGIDAVITPASQTAAAK